MSAPRDQKPVALSPEEWGNRFWKTACRVLVAEARERLEKPSPRRVQAAWLSYRYSHNEDDADVEVDGENMDADWDEPAADWMNAKKAAVHTVMAANSMDMIAAVRSGELLGAMDVNRRGASDVRFWGINVGTPFELYRLRGVPLRDALPLNDFGSRMTRLRDGRQGWALGRRYADSHPFKRVR